MLVFDNEMKQEVLNQLTQDKVTAEEQAEAILDYAERVAENAAKQVRAEYEAYGSTKDAEVLAKRGIVPLTAEETKFYNAAIEKGKFDSDEIWPVTILERVFDGLQEERPLLRLINFIPSSANVKIVRSRRKGKAVFGPIHKDVEGQLEAEFDAKEFSQIALTAFFLISNDTLDLGPVWVDRYVRLCLTEAIADAWEEAIVTGDGVDKPIGLLREPDTTGTPEKTAKGTLTFADAATMVKELAGVHKALSEYTDKIGAKDATGVKKYRKVQGQVYLLVNPKHYYDIVARVTTQNANGVFVSNLPFISSDRIIESLHVPEDKLIAFVAGEYDATQSRAEKLYTYKETFAMRRATLYAVDMTGNGRPSNNDAAHVYDIAIPS